MDWWKEVARMCLNFAVLTVGALCYTTVTGRWDVKQFLLGVAIATLWFVLSRLAWKKGGQ